MKKKHCAEWHFAGTVLFLFTRIQDRRLRFQLLVCRSIPGKSGILCRGKRAAELGYRRFNGHIGKSRVLITLDKAVPLRIIAGALPQKYQRVLPSHTIDAHDLNLIFNGSCPKQCVPMGTALCQPVGRYEQNGSLLCRQPEHFREAQVIADQRA